ncbi:MAG: ThuA domain-containing protein [Alphaproteobacteria bacterium]|nr:ThuA domain-containing protein [Alphaproteobacteria bacterium]
MNFARRQLLQKLEKLENGDNLSVTIANDFLDIERWLPEADLLITYVAGPYPVGAGNDALQSWLEAGGRWLALHGTSGGKATKTERNGRPVKMMVKDAHHDTLGCFFLNHPPISAFNVNVTNDHPVTRGLPDSFTVQDELYLIELLDPSASRILLTTELEKDPSPPGFGFVFDEDTSVQSDGKTRVLGYARDVGQGEVVYIGLGHCHTGRIGRQSAVDVSIDPTGLMPPELYSVWESDEFVRLLENGVAWGLGQS